MPRGEERLDLLDSVLLTNIQLSTSTSSSFQGNSDISLVEVPSSGSGWSVWIGEQSVEGNWSGDTSINNEHPLERLQVLVGPT
ncbi:hypothetical protein WICPIJ_006377 [Wickerhamomyces pijperi]|uniref:Uncharacterized protein n=1 Tax=Wickerhamomyces pijperi TaxID=599730 RepID=A0A9P8Q1T3_WICPI|nr:hypothetical protein WICPIJ_006377 [Wickerhamomyces pijperi]